MELRSSIRYRFAAPAIFTWEGPEARRLQGEGFTRDVSFNGAYVLTPTCPPPDALVTIEIFAPLHEIGLHDLRFLAEGRVVRVEHPLGKQDGFAMVTEGLELSKSRR